MTKCARCDNVALPTGELCDECSSTDATQLAVDAPTRTFEGTQGEDPTVRGDAPTPADTGTDLPPTRALSDPEPRVTSTQPAPTTLTEEVNQPAERFTLNEVLGEGAQGQVCLAFDNHLQRQVAIKFPQGGTQQQEAKAILDEARKAARLNHPNVVTIYDCGFWQGRPFISMEYVDGASLSHIAKEVGRLSVGRFLNFGNQILKALEAAHASGLIHRDLKPHNVLFAKDGTLKLTDFGVAHVRSDVARKARTTKMPIAGTPAYMAPEQWLGNRSDGRADLYAFGCVAYQLLGGAPPFSGKDVATHCLQSKPKPLSESAPHVPPDIEAVIMRCLEKEPDKRYQSATEVRVALKKAAKALRMSEGRTTAQGPSTETLKRRSAFMPTLVVAFVLIAGGAWFFSSHEKGQELWSKYVRGAQVATDTGSDPQPPVENGDDKDDETVDPKAELERERREQALAKLEQAEGMDDSREKIALAREASDDLTGEDRTRAEALIASTQRALQAKTEEEATSEFEAILAEGDAQHTKKDYLAALEAFDSAESMRTRYAFLARRATELAEHRLPTVVELAKLHAATSRFGAAAARYEEAGKIADELGQELQKKRYRRSAEVAGKLELLQMMVARQPRFALIELTHYLDTREFPSAQLLRAEAHLALGKRASANRLIEAFLQSEPHPDLEAQAKKMLELTKR